jgi:hypothetical protein
MRRRIAKLKLLESVVVRVDWGCFPKIRYEFSFCRRDTTGITASAEPSCRRAGACECRLLADTELKLLDELLDYYSLQDGERGGTTAAGPMEVYWFDTDRRLVDSESYACTDVPPTHLTEGYMLLRRLAGEFGG